MKKLFLAIIVIVLVAIIFAVLFGVFNTNVAFSSQSNEKIKIGVMAPFSGQTAWWGEYIRQGIDLALSELPQEKRDNIQLIFEDDACTAQGGITAANKLIFADNAKYVVGPLCNEATIPTEALFENNKVISLTTGLPNNKIANMGPYHFSYLPEIESLMKELARFAYFSNGDKNVAIIYIEGDYGYENYFHFKNYFESFGGKVVAEEQFSIDSTDVRSQLSKIKSANPDAILLVTHGPSLINVLQQMQTLGLNPKHKYGVNAFESPQILTEAASLAEGVVYPSSQDVNTTTAMTAYAEKYFAKYKTKPDVYSANAYDSFKILYAAIEKCGKENVDCVQEQLSSVKNYPGANGTFSVDARGEGIYNSVLLKTVKDGNFVPLDAN